MNMYKVIWRFVNREGKVVAGGDAIHQAGNANEALRMNLDDLEWDKAPFGINGSFVQDVSLVIDKDAALLEFYTAAKAFFESDNSMATDIRNLRNIVAKYRDYFEPE